ncbi:hypothetical protein HA402_004565 [Bradysia odoriphaga]|nr:hypothetical protein HA402_004565 [Bradysia odoriphaga]
MALHRNDIKSYIAIITILFCLPIEIECCSLTTDYIVNLIYDKESFLQDPCYIQWKANQDAKLEDPLQPTVETALIEFDRWRIQEAIDVLLNQQKSNSSSSLPLPAPEIFNTVAASSSQQNSRVNIPPMAARQDSLPSYDEAVKMASPPPEPPPTQ